MIWHQLEKYFKVIQKNIENIQLIYYFRKINLKSKTVYGYKI